MSNVNMAMAHKFMEPTEALPAGLQEALASYRAPPSGKAFGTVNPSERILIMIDEAHRTQNSDLGENLFEAFPNATRIAFTGTPLIMEQHGASGGILEAEQRIAAIARALVDHYVDNILPDGFKAQVVCHSKLAAIRYQKAIRAALAERLEREKLQSKPDQELIRRIAFLKAAVVVSSGATNEPAAITEARREAKHWNAVETRTGFEILLKTKRFGAIRKSDAN